MLVLAETDRVGGRWRRCQEELEEMRFLGVNCLRLTLCSPEEPGERRLVRQETRCRALLRAFHGTELCFREGTPSEEPLRRQLPEATAASLWEAAAMDVVRETAARRESVFLCVRRLTPCVLGAFRRLCRDFRYITLEAPPPAAERLRFEGERCGVSLAVLRQDRQVEADAAIFYAEPDSPVIADSQCVVMTAWGRPGEWLRGGRPVTDVVFRYPEELRRTLPEGYPEDVIFAAAVRAETVSLQEIEIERVTF